MNIQSKISTLLQRRAKDTDHANVIASKEIDTCKHQLHSFQSGFVPPRHQNFSQKHIDKLKKAAESLTLKFELVYNNPNKAIQQPQTKRQPKHITTWKLPNLFGEKIVTNQALALGFSSVSSPPHPNR